MLYYSDDDPDQDFEGLDGDPLEALEVWRAECERSREIVDNAPSLDATGAVARNGSYTLRWLMLRMIAECAQHAGHAVSCGRESTARWAPEPVQGRTWLTTASGPRRNGSCKGHRLP
jgi:Protein of unknown function (DUF664)